MDFSNTTSKSGLLQDCEFWCGFDDAGITGNATLKAQFTGRLNDWYHKVVTMILAAQDAWDWDDTNKTNYPVATTPLVASQRDYTFPTSLKILKIKRVDVTYDGSTYYKVEPFDSSETGLGLGNDTTVDARFSKTSPFYDLKSTSIWLYPMASAADVTAGGKLRIEFFREPTEFTTSDTTAEPGFDEPFHRMLSLGASLDYCVRQSLPQKNDLAALLKDYEERLRLYYGRKDQDTNPQLKPADTDYE